MYKIGDFSKLAKVTTKTLRYYEKEGLLVPKRIDSHNGYRYYDGDQLVEISKILSMRQLGFSIEEIKQIRSGQASFNEILNAKKQGISKNIEKSNYQLLKINYLLGENNINQEIFEKCIPAHYVYYKDGILENNNDYSDFILKSGIECKKLNPNIKCVVPDYCYMCYLDKEYKEKCVKVRYSQAVIREKQPFVDNDSIKFREVPETQCICIYHKGSYDTLSKSYGKVMKYIEDNDYEITDYPRECYINGAWNKDDTEEWLTEIQVPVRRKN